MAQLELQRQTCELAESEARLRIVTENAHVGLAIVREDRTYVYANRTYAEILGLDRAFAGERVAYEMDLDRGRAIALRYEPTGDGAGAPLVVGVVTDISDRRQAEAAVRLNHERFQTVARATNDAVWDWDLRTDDLWWNKGYRSGFGYAPNDIESLAATRGQRVHPDDRERVMTGLEALVANGQQTWSDEYRFRRRDGSSADVVSRGFVIRDGQGQPLRMVGAMQDVSDRKRAEAAERAASAVHLPVAPVKSGRRRRR